MLSLDEGILIVLHITYQGPFFSKKDDILTKNHYCAQAVKCFSCETDGPIVLVGRNILWFLYQSLKELPNK